MTALDPGHPPPVTLPSGDRIRLKPSAHVATGGEGAVYRVGALAVKLYLDPDRAIAAGAPQRIRRLAGLTHPAIVAPIGLVTNDAGQPVGCAMPWVDGAVPLVTVFTNDWRARTGFGDADAARLVEALRAAVAFAHTADAVIVDGNEMNTLCVGGAPRLIDVDSWQVPGCPATAIMASIRDWHSTGFSEATDWFAWGIVTFQVFVGIHPYKGTHPDFRRGDLDGRMRANASVFDARVRLNAAVRDLATIPDPLRAWYQATFQDGQRTPPPALTGAPRPGVRPRPAAAVAAPAARPAGTGPGAPATSAFAPAHLFQAPSPVRRVFACGIALCDDGSLCSLDNGRRLGVLPVVEAVLAAPGGGFVAAWVEGTRLRLALLDAGTPIQPLDPSVAASGVVLAAGRLFARGVHGLSEIVLRRMGQRLLASVGRTWEAPMDATRLFDGLAVVDVLGAMHMMLPQPGVGVALVRVPDLDGRTVIAGVHEAGRARVVCADRHGALARLDLLLTADRGRIGARSEVAVDSGDLNAVVTPAGAVHALDDNGGLEVSDPGQVTPHPVPMAGPALGGSARLVPLAAGVGLVQGRDVWRLV